MVEVLWSGPNTPWSLALHLGDHSMWVWPSILPQPSLTVEAINLDTDNELAQEFLKQVPANFSVRFNPEGDVARSFDLLGMPSSFMFNRQGQLVQHHVGFYADKAAEYEQELVSLLKE